MSVVQCPTSPHLPSCVPTTTEGFAVMKLAVHAADAASECAYGGQLDRRRFEKLLKSVPGFGLDAAPVLDEYLPRIAALLRHGATKKDLPDHLVQGALADRIEAALAAFQARRDSA